MTCNRCGQVYLFGACPVCLGYRHVWTGRSQEKQVCRICFISRETFRKYLPGNKGSSFKRAYDGEITKAPRCYK